VQALTAPMTQYFRIYKIRRLRAFQSGNKILRRHHAHLQTRFVGCACNVRRKNDIVQVLQCGLNLWFPFENVKAGRSYLAPAP